METETQAKTELLSALSSRELLSEKQNELDVVMETLSEEVEMWNLRMAERSLVHDENMAIEIAEMAQQATISLDEKWPFMGDYIHVSGLWHVPKIQVGYTGLEFPMEKKEAFNIVQSNGFSVFESEESAPKVGLSFVVSQVPIMSAAIQGNMTLITYADPSEVILMYARPETLAGEYSTRLDQLGENLMYYDSLLMLHYHNQHSEFYKKSAKQQKKFLDQVVDGISDALPSPGIGQAATCEQVTTPYVYRRVESNGRRFWQKMTSNDGELLMLSGKIDGVGILEVPELDSGQPYRSRNQLVDPDAGVCLVLHVEQSSIAHDFNNEPIYVPLRPAEELNIAVA